jgi:hypothetical protein
LDWTFNARTACYFAAIGAARDSQKYQGGKLIVWALSANAYELEKWTKLLERGTQPPMKVVKVPRAGNPNLAAQEGLFTVTSPSALAHIAEVEGLKDEELSEIERLPLDQLLGRYGYCADIDEPLLVGFRVPTSEAPRLLRLLSKDGINAGRLFPGFDGAAKAVEEEQYWDRPPHEEGEAKARRSTLS